MNTLTVNGALYQKLLLSGSAVLEKNREIVNNLNVFPVPDGDTGTNMSLTMSAVSSNSGHNTDSLDSYSAAVARDMMRAARGNSGVILSLFFRGMARAFQGHSEADPALFREAFREGAKSAASAVENPVEGTILTVMRECCAETTDTPDIDSLLDTLYSKAYETLQKTPEMLPALRRARVVDSGGCGFVHIIDGMRRALSGEFTNDNSDPLSVSVPVIELAETADFSEFNTEEITFSFCTECLLDLDGSIPSATLSSLRSYLSSIGDSMVLTADEEIFKLHIHTNDPFDVLSKVTKLGTLRFSKIENMKLQHDGIAAKPKKKDKKEKEKEEELEKARYGIFAVSPGEGFSDLFCELGANRIISGGQSMNPSADDIIDAINSYTCETAIILPNNSNIILTAQQVARILDNVKVLSVDTKTIPQGISSLIAFNCDRTPEENLEAMKSAAADVQSVSVTDAVRDAEADGLNIKKGSKLGLIDGKIKASTEDIDSLIPEIFSQTKDGELITVYYGEDVSEEEAENVASMIGDIVGEDVDISVISGGQPVYQYIISVE